MRASSRHFASLALVGALACTRGSGGAGDVTPDDLGIDGVDGMMDGPDGPPDEGGPDMGEAPCVDPGGTLGGVCFGDADCDDSCFCNGTERCRRGVCVAGDAPCEDDLGCTFRACDEEGESCGDLELRAEVCDDGNVCTGVELCDPVLGCVGGEPLDCSDGDRCTVDRCDPERGCENAPAGPEICDNFEDDDCDGQADVFDPDCTPTNDTCATAIELASSGFYGFGTTGLNDDYEPRCSRSGDAIDAVFFFDLLTEMDLYVELTDGPDDAVLELRGPGDVGVCADDARAATDGVPCERSNVTAFGLPFPATIEQNLSSPGRYFLLLETEDETVGTLQFELSTPPPPRAADRCGTAPTLPATGGVLTEDVRLLRDAHDAPSCGASDPQPDACYVLDLAVPQDVALSAEFLLGSGAAGPGAIAVVDDFDEVVRTERDCASGSAPELVLRGLPAGLHYILVERTSRSVVSHELEVDIAPVGTIRNCDLCRSACTAAPPAAGATPRTVDLSLMALDEPTLGCTLPAGAQNDTFFTFVTTVADEEVGLELGAPSTFAYSIDASGTCPATTPPICRFGGVLGPVSTTVTVPDIGAHHLAIQTGARTGSLTVEIDPTGVAAP